MADLKSYFQGYDLDSGGGTDYVLGVNLRLTASGGSTEALGQKAMASSLPVVIASDQSAVTVSVSGAVDTELSAAAALADATANPTVTSVGAFNLGFNGTTWDRIRTANTGRLQVDVITGGGSDTPTNPVVSYVTSAAVAAGATANLDTAEAAAKKLRQVQIWSSVAFKAALHTVDNGVESTNPKGMGGAAAMGQCVISTPHRNYVTLGTTAGADTFRIKFTNLDDANAADAYCVFMYED